MNLGFLSFSSLIYKSHFKCLSAVTHKEAAIDDTLLCLFQSLLSLSEMFELPKQVVHSTISKMIINEELPVPVS